MVIATARANETLVNDITPRLMRAIKEVLIDGPRFGTVNDDTKVYIVDIDASKQVNYADILLVEAHNWTVWRLIIKASTNGTYNHKFSGVTAKEVIQFAGEELIRMYDSREERVYLTPELEKIAV